ncbi:hypothetical protein J6590_011103 [Homalodisca vitripennis]|nr:hypothetical protein J6590_011103 [Homalodisca vitripennis]
MCRVACVRHLIISDSHEEVARIPVTTGDLCFQTGRIRAVVASGIAKASIQRVNKSVTIRIFVFPRKLLGYDPIRSGATTS